MTAQHQERDDITVRFHGTSSDPHATVRLETRATRATVHCAPKETRRYSVAPNPGLDTAALGDRARREAAQLAATLEAWRGTWHDGPPLRATLTATWAARRYADSDGIQEASESFWADIHVHVADGHRAHEPSLMQVRDGAADIDDVRAALERAARRQQQTLTRRSSLPPIQAPLRGIPLLLTPATAGIVLHELVAHRREQRRRAAPAARWGPDELTVAAVLPSSRAFDDDGSVARQALLLKAGRPTNALADALDFDFDLGLDPHPPCSGLAQAAWHHAQARLRLTHLEAAAGEPVAGLTAVPRALVVYEICAAEYCDEVAVFGTHDAVVCHDGTAAGRLSPAVLVLDGASLLTARVGDDVLAGPAGRCVKAGQSLPSVVRSPSLLLRDYQWM